MWGAAGNVNDGGAVIADEGGYAINDGAFAGIASNNTKITINTASVIAGSACAIHSTGAGTTVTVNNGLVSNAAGNNANPAIQINAATNVDYGDNYNVIINGGTVQSASGAGYAIQTTGNLLINGGLVTSVNGRAVNLVGEYSKAVVNDGIVRTVGTGTAISTATTSPGTVPNTKVFVNGGTVSSALGSAIHVTGENSEVLVSGGTITTASVTDGSAIQAGISSTYPAANAKVIVSGGSVSASGGASNSYAIRTYGTGSSVFVSDTGGGRGGQVSVLRTGAAVRSNGTVTVNGGFVFAFGTSPSTAVNAASLNLPSYGDGGIIGVWHQAAGAVLYEQGNNPAFNTRDLEHAVGDPANLKWYFNPALGSGIDYRNGRTSGFFPLHLVTVTNDHGLIFDSSTGFMYKDLDGTGSLETNYERFFLGTNMFSPSEGAWLGTQGNLILNDFSWVTTSPISLTIAGDATVTLSGTSRFESVHDEGIGINADNYETVIAGSGSLHAKGSLFGINLKTTATPSHLETLPVINESGEQEQAEEPGVLTLQGGTLIAEGRQAIYPADPDYGTETGPGPNGLYYYWEYVGNYENNFKTDSGYSVNNRFVYHPTDTYVMLRALEPVSLISAEQVGGVFDKADSTGIRLTFNVSADGLTSDYITITDGTGAVQKGELIGSGSEWKILLDGVYVQGTVDIEIERNFGNYFIQNNTVYDVSVYKMKYYKLTVKVNDEAGGFTAEHETGEYYYPEGVEIAVTAVPNDGYDFMGWTVNYMDFMNDDNAAKTFIMPLFDIELTANFKLTPEPQQPPVTTTAPPVTTTTPPVTTTTPPPVTTTTPPPVTTTTPPPVTTTTPPPVTTTTPPPVTTTTLPPVTTTTPPSATTTTPPVTTTTPPVTMTTPPPVTTTTPPPVTTTTPPVTTTTPPPVTTTTPPPVTTTTPPVTTTTLPPVTTTTPLVTTTTLPPVTTTTPPVTTTSSPPPVTTTTPPPVPPVIQTPEQPIDETSLRKLTVIAGEGGRTLGCETGLYHAGSVIEITEEAYSGSHFSGWMVSGMTFTNNNIETIKFIMPLNDVEVIARFEHDTGPDKNPKSGAAANFTAVMLFGGALYIIRQRIAVILIPTKKVCKRRYNP
jgi:hypothetical protein